MKAHFAYSAKGLPFAAMTFTYRKRTLELDALVDSGSMVNVLPLDVGQALGLSWEEQMLLLEPGGFLRGAPAYAVKVLGQVANFPRLNWCLRGVENQVERFH